MSSTGGSIHSGRHHPAKGRTSNPTRSATPTTNTTTNLEPGTYQIEIKKDGYQPWKKTLALQAEIVTRASATLFPSVPSLKAITTGGASNPVLSPDGTKVAFTQAGKLYTLDLTESPLGLISRDPKLLSTVNYQLSTISWSPDSRQILSSNLLIDTTSSQVSSVSALTLSSWTARRQTLDAQRFLTLPSAMQNLLATSAADLAWSPKETKLLYTATASAVIPDRLKSPLPGSSTQTQDRHLTPKNVYVYDLEEDRNFKIDSGYSWFPDSYHLFKTANQQVIITEYDGQNQTVVYDGPMEPNFAAPYPSGKQILILTNLNPSLSSIPNLYAVSLR
ncbi:PEGA domain-containing protein [Candidatus Amesbacteria bacterium]|nr:PEGA domain-containing protein [Candidatus Amesbacteria bacterium]